MVRRLLPLLLACLLIFSQIGKTSEPPGDGPYELLYVVDGDTVRIDYYGEKEYVRMIGLDCPELRDKRPAVAELAQACKEHLEELLEGQAIYLQWDQRRRDRYGRLLAYVHLQDGSDVCLRMLEDGYAYHFRRYPHGRMETYDEAEAAAREAEAGLWGE